MTYRSFCLTVVLFALFAVLRTSKAADYVSPYEFAPSVNYPSVMADFHQMPRDPSNWRNWSLAPFREWTNLDFILHRTRSIWGPRFIAFPAPAGVLSKPATWQQRRLVSAGSQICGRYPYAHHHMQVWNAPDAPEWTAHHITPGVGIDCSDFTNWMYNYGLGVELKTGIGEQAAAHTVDLRQADGQRRTIRTQRLFDTNAGFVKDFATLTAGLQPGDLLFIRGRPEPGRITHVIMWLGNLASDTLGKDSYLVMDSHGDKVIDSRGVIIPSGPKIRPFRQKSYYFNCFDHVLRIVPLTPAR